MTSKFVTSADGTQIAYSVTGSGPALVAVHCVGVSRATDPLADLPPVLAEHFTVYSYDRRGKGESGNTAPYAVEREFEDLAAMIEAAGGQAIVFGFSSGAVLALLAARAGLDISRLALLEPPLMADADSAELVAEFERRLAADGPAATHRWYDTEIVGVPEEILEQLPLGAEDLANTPAIVHDLHFLPGLDAADLATVAQPTLIVASDQTDPVIYQSAESLQRELPSCSYRMLPGEWHGVDPQTLTAAIAEFAGA